MERGGSSSRSGRRWTGGRGSSSARPPQSVPRPPVPAVSPHQVVRGSSRPRRLMRDFFSPAAGRKTLSGQRESVVEWLTQQGPSTHSFPSSGSSVSSTSTNIASAAPLAPAAAAPATAMPQPDPPSSPALFDEEEEECMGELWGQAIEEALDSPGEGQALMASVEEEMSQIFSTSTAPSAQATVEVHEGQVQGPMSHHAPSPSVDLGSDDEEGDRDWVPPQRSPGSSSQSEPERLPVLTRVRTAPVESRGRDSAGGVGSSSIQAQSEQQQVGQRDAATPAVRIQAQIGVTPTAASVPPVSRGSTRLSSPVWAYFTVHGENVTRAVCSLCHGSVSRGKLSSGLGTSGLMSHLRLHHRREWELIKGKRVQGSNGQSSGEVSAAGTSPAICSVQVSHPAPSHSTSIPSARQAGRGTQSLAAPSSSSLTSSTFSAAPCAQRQASVPELLQRKRPLPSDHPTVVRNNGLLARLLAQQLLPYQLVESAPFRQLMSCLAPQWRIPSRHYFARTAVPALHQYVVERVARSLDFAVGGRVHLTTDAWSSRHGQGRYLTFTAHWVTLHGAGEGDRGAAFDLVVPPRGVKGRRVPLPSATTSVPGQAAAEPPSKRPRSYASMQHRRCQAVLQLVSLGERRHTGPDVLSALEDQVRQWLTPRNLRAGNVVSDNGTNILSALRLGSLTHVPCLAHVLNLIVQRFLRTCVGLSAVVRLARDTAAHFRRSPTDAASLGRLQRQHGLPQHRLIVDCPTRWNSTLHMLERLWEQRQAVRMCQSEVGSSRVSTLSMLSGGQWKQIQQVCRVLAPFDQATKMVSGGHTNISSVLPLVFLLDRTLGHLVEQGEEALLERAQATRGVAEQTQALEDDEQQELGPEQEGEQMVRVWDDSEDGEQQPAAQGSLEQEEEEEEVQQAHLFPMAAHMLFCLRRDPRIKAIKSRDDYWVATLLDPRVKGKLGQFLSNSNRDTRIPEIRDVLIRQLKERFPSAAVDAPVPLTHHTQQVAGNSSAGTAGDLLGVMRDFFQPECTSTPGSSGSHRQRLARMVHDYLGSVSGQDTMHTDDPMEYWVARLDTWPELAQYALEVLACPASSVLSERVFSAAGGVVTDTRTRLSTDNVGRLTFIKMNESWISEDFSAPPTDSSD